MTSQFVPVAFLLFLTLWRWTVAGPDSPSAEQTFDVAGEVKLFRAGSNAALKDASSAVVWLSPQGAIQPARLVTPAGKYRMIQHNKMFEPSLLVVPLGSLVDFPNLDPWFHNVFSLYRGKRFDLGLYEAGAQKTIKFDRPGASYIFCNIHPEMAAVVLTVDSNFYAISDKSGRVSIAHVPRGKYLLRAWYENADSRSLDALTRPVEIDRNNDGLLSLAIPVTEEKSPRHKNKYGRDYDPKVTEY
jgi:plastocyanin